MTFTFHPAVCIYSYSRLHVRWKKSIFIHSPVRTHQRSDNNAHRPHVHYISLMVHAFGSLINIKRGIQSNRTNIDSRNESANQKTRGYTKRDIEQTRKQENAARTPTSKYIARARLEGTRIKRQKTTTHGSIIDFVFFQHACFCIHVCIFFVLRM